MNRVLGTAVLFLACSCSDDTQPPGDRGVSLDQRRADGVKPTEAKPPQLEASAFPEARPADQGGWTCTPGAANMCDDYKTQYCLNGHCTPCPANKTDCDRKGDCECAGICDGTKCKTP